MSSIAPKGEFIVTPSASMNLRALVCGASQGIGAATALLLARQGVQVIALARSKDKLQALIESLPGKGHIFIAQDMFDLEGLSLAITETLKSGPIQIIINNGGGPKGGALLAASDQEFLKGFTEHILVAQNLMRLLLPGMQSEGYGRVINIISTSVKAPIPNLGVSNTIRGAMASWAKTLANELGPFGVTVNNVLPGYTQTPRLGALRKATAERLKITEAEVEKSWKAQTPTGRFAAAEEVAAAICFLASAQAGMITGINLPVDGGRTPCL